MILMRSMVLVRVSAGFQDAVRACAISALTAESKRSKPKQEGEGLVACGVGPQWASRAAVTRRRWRPRSSVPASCRHLEGVCPGSPPSRPFSPRQSFAFAEVGARGALREPVGFSRSCRLCSGDFCDPACGALRPACRSAACVPSARWGGKQCSTRFVTSNLQVEYGKCHTQR